MGKLEKAIKIHMVYGLVFVLLALWYPRLWVLTFTMYPPVNIGFFLLWVLGKPLQNPWLIFAPLVLFVTEMLEWLTLEILKHRKRNEIATGSEVVEYR